MSQAEELLNNLYNTENELRLANASEEPHIVVDDNRIISVPDKLKRIAVQFDHNIETVTFDCPRYWDNHDMSEMIVYINYLGAGGVTGTYKAQDIEVDDTDANIMHFTWTISKNATLMPGKIAFLVCVKNADEDGNEINHWNSELCKDCYVSEGLEDDGELINELAPDLITQWYQEVLAVIKEVENTTASLIEMRDSGELDGATFTPSVSPEGDLSWTNDKGRENPEPANIRGPDGISPTIEVSDIPGGHRIVLTDLNGTNSFDILDTIMDKTEAAVKMLNDFVYIGSVEPTSVPVLWIDTDKTPAAN